MFRPSVSPLAHLLFKNHLEMRELFSMLNASLEPVVPVDVSLSFANSRSTFSLDRETGKLQFTFAEGDNSYHLYIPTRPVDGRYEPIGICFGNGRHIVPIRYIKPENFATLQVPPHFKALHERVTAHLARILPPAIAQAMGLTGDRAAKTSLEAATAPELDKEAKAAELARAEAGDPPADKANVEPEAPVSPQVPAEPEYCWYVVSRDDAPDLRFKAKLLTRLASAPRQGRQHLFEVFQTESGKYVGVRSGLSWWVGEHHRVKTVVTENKADLVEFFGYSSLAKALYQRIDIEAVETVA